MIEYRRVLDEVIPLEQGNVSLVTQLSKEEQLLQPEKLNVKTSFQLVEKRWRYLQYLGKEQSAWPSVKETEEKLKQCRRERTEVKTQLENAKEQLYTLLETLVKEQNLLKEKVTKLEEKMATFEHKKKIFESKHSVDADSAIARCEQAVQQIVEEVCLRKQEITLAEQEIRHLKSELDKMGKARTSDGTQQIERLQEIVRFVESVSGVRVSQTGPLQLQVEVCPSTPLTQSVVPAEKALSLEMTLIFNATAQNELRLSDVKISVEHFSLENVTAVAIANNDVPYLILSAREQWTTHFPLLSEIEVLNQSYAIDWIPEQGKLRVLVGKCGKTMFTLSVPGDYPLTRDITLLDSYGVDSVDTNDLPDKEATLLDWVQYLEEKYGNL